MVKNKARKWIGNVRLWGLEIAILNRVVREGATENATFKK